MSGELVVVCCRGQVAADRGLDWPSWRLGGQARVPEFGAGLSKLGGGNKYNNLVWSRCRCRVEPGSRWNTWPGHVLRQHSTQFRLTYESGPISRLLSSSFSSTRFLVSFLYIVSIPCIHHLPTSGHLSSYTYTLPQLNRIPPSPYRRHLHPRHHVRHPRVLQGRHPETHLRQPVRLPSPQ